MKLGFLTTKVEDIEKAARLGFPGIELDAQAFGDALAGELDAERVAGAGRLAEEHGVEITALAFYALGGSRASVEEVVAGYERVFGVAERLGVRVVASMSGFDADRDWDGNVRLFAERFGPVAERAEARGLKIAFENWMGYWGRLPVRPVNMGV